MGSACELEYHLLLACDLKLLQIQKFQSLQMALLDVKRMLSGLLAKLSSAKTDSGKLRADS